VHLIALISGDVPKISGSANSFGVNPPRLVWGLMAELAPVYTFRNVAIRRNLIRFVPRSSNSGPQPLANDIATYQGENVLIERNIVEITHPAFESLKEAKNKTVRYFGNQSPAGEPVRGLNNNIPVGSPGRAHEELFTRVRDVLISALL
jgi:hypothetical protein